MNKTPPKYFLQFFRWFCDPDYVDDIEGDLLERFDKRTQLKKQARWNFMLDVIKLFRPGIIKNFEGTKKLNYYGMFRHNLLITFRNFKRYRSSFLINLVGLSSGLTAVLLIYLWVSDELSVDKFHTKDDRLYQVMGNFRDVDNINTWNGMPTGISAALKDEFPEIEYAIGATDPGWGLDFTLKTGDKKVVKTGRFVGKDFFNLFSYKLVNGTQDEVLKGKESIVISKSLAKSLFGTYDVIGQSLEWNVIDNGRSSIITGVFEEPASFGTDKFDVLVPFEIYKEANGDDLLNLSSIAYVLLREGASKEVVNAKIKNFIADRVEDSNTELFLQKYSDQYLYGNFENGIQSGGRIEYVRLFSIIALFTLCIACINFMNLSTARASRRMKEVGVKKTFGVSRNSLAFQYLGEATMMAFLSCLVALILVRLALPAFNNLTDKTIVLSLDLNLISAGLIITLVTGLLAGSYPALYLSSFKPVAVLKGKVTELKGESWTRKGLVIFQFSISIILILSVYVVYKQIDYVQNKSLGYDNSHLVRIRNTSKVAQNLETFLQEIKKIPGVENASAFINSPYNPPGTPDFSWPGSEGVNTNLSRFIVHYDFIETFGLELTDGQTLSRNFAKPQIVINEQAVQHMGLSEPIGSKARLWGQEVTIVGVVKDFHFKSLHQQIEPMLFHILPADYMAYLIVRLDSDVQGSMERIEEFYKEYNDTSTFEYQFLSDDYHSLYESEKRVSSISKYFAGIAIIISCLGLFGLASFTAERRIKEIGIRKILGSSILGIIKLLVEDFTRLLAASIVVGLSVGYLITKNWLDDFAFRIELEWWFFLVVGLLTLATAWLSVGYQVIKVARVNPAECLRDE